MLDPGGPQLCGQILSRQCPRAVGSHADKMQGEGRNQRDHLPVVLIPQHAEKDAELLPGQVFLKIARQCLRALGVVPAVHDEQGMIVQQLETARPGDVGEALPDGVVGDAPAPSAEHL